MGSVYTDIRQTEDKFGTTIDLGHEEKAFDVWGELKSNRAMLINMIIMTVVWLSGSFNYYLISYQLKYLEGDLYINSIVSSLSEIVANITSAISIYFFGLKNAFMISFILAAAGMLCLIYVDTEN